ncbi:hypothetical protein C0989_006288 [Termitomyces sp. Mn162]|nr:hypothetical protein C0989_006288 [Termitomyces sp. Mn162]
MPPLPADVLHQALHDSDPLLWRLPLQQNKSPKTGLEAPHSCKKSLSCYPSLLYQDQAPWSSMLQLANSDTLLEASAPQDKAWTCLLHLETQVQLTQSSLTHHTTELSTLHQTTDLISQSLQALLKHLSPNSAPSAAAELAPPATALTPVDLVTL